jgi:hypothetical protein
MATIKNTWDMPKKVTVHYLNKEKYEPTVHRNITRIYHDEQAWYLFSENYVSAQIKFDEVLRIEYELEGVPVYPQEGE